MIRFIISVLELLGVVFLRFRLVPRLWNVWLVGLNLACVLFITHFEAQVVLAVTTISVLSQAAVYQKIGFTRVLGIVHFLWIPMFAWMATRIGIIQAHPALAQWLTLLLVTNIISLIVDITDVTRFIGGERAPHYHWRRMAAA